MSVVGGRPNFMKIAPIIEAIERQNGDRLEDDGVTCSSEHLFFFIAIPPGLEGCRVPHFSSLS